MAHGGNGCGKGGKRARAPKLPKAFGDARRMLALAAGLAAAAMRLLLTEEVEDPVLALSGCVGAPAPVLRALRICLPLHGLLASFGCLLPHGWAVRAGIAAVALSFFVSAAEAVAAMCLGVGAAWIPYAACDMQSVGAAALLLWFMADEDEP